MLLLVRDVLRFAGRAHPIALDRFGQDDGRLAFVLRRRVVGRVDLARVVTAALQVPNLFVGPIRHQLGRLRVASEEMLAHEGAVVGLERLILAVDALVHQLNEPSGLVALEQRVPVAAPDHLEDVPTRAAKLAFEFLDDLTVAAHGAVEPLQIAVDHEDQVIEPLARGDRDRAERFRFVAFAVA